MKQIFKKTYPLMCTLLVVFVFITVKVFFSSYSQFNQAKKACDREEVIACITHYDRSIQWYFPFNPITEKSLEGLFSLGEKLQKKGDMKRARIAYRTLRSSLLAVRGVYTPYSDWILQTDLAMGNPWKNSNLQKKNKLIVKGPNVGWALFVTIAFSCWTGSMIWAIFYSSDNKEVKTFRYFLVRYFPVLLFYAAWITGLFFA